MKAGLVRALCTLHMHLDRLYYSLLTTTRIDIDIDIKSLLDRGLTVWIWIVLYIYDIPYLNRFY